MRSRRHSRISEALGHRVIREEPVYMKLKKRFRHESQHGYFELSYSKRIYDKLEDMEPYRNVTELTADLLSRQGIKMEELERDSNDDYLLTNEVSIDGHDSSRTRWKRFDHSKDNSIHSRMDPIALIEYCCIHPHDDKCKIQTCFH